MSKFWIHETATGLFNTEVDAATIDDIPEGYKTADFTASAAIVETRPTGTLATLVEEEWGVAVDAPTDTYAQASLLAAMRAQRNLLLAQTDFTQGADVPIDGTVKTAFQVYRQALRDMPSVQSIATIYTMADWVWPTMPTYTKAS